MGPLALSVLYLRKSTPEAIPQYISGRTSYLRVCLAFHPYPQLIRAVFNLQRFGPPLGFTQASPWPWIDHPVSGLLRMTHALFRLAFATAPLLNSLTSPYRVTRWPIMQKARGHTTRAVLPRLVGNWFQVLFHSPNRGPFHLSLTVLVRYRSLGSI